jgi:cytoskeletal protein CcmA (bactofilin family)
VSKIYDELKGAEQMRSNGQSHIHSGLTIKGEISGNEDLVADGNVEGPITLTDAILTIGESGSVKGNLAAKEIIVHGSVTGNVTARERVVISSKGSIVGDIVTSRIAIEDGARCKGSIEIGGK